MDASYTTPILLTAGMTFANDWYQGKVNFRPLLGGGIAVLVAAVLAEIPGMGPVVTGIAWVAFAAALVVPAQHGQKTPLDTLLGILNSSQGG